MGYAVRLMKKRDIPQVTAIEREAFKATSPPTPFERELGNSMACYLVAYRELEEITAEPASYVVESRWSKIRTSFSRLRNSWPLSAFVFGARFSPPALGFIGIWFAVDEVHITAISTKASHRGKGVGELLLLACIDMAAQKGSDVISLEVRVSNQIAQSLYRKYAFRTTGVRKAYYADNKEDAYIMTTDPISSPEYQGRLARLQNAYCRRWGKSTWKASC